MIEPTINTGETWMWIVVVVDVVGTGSRNHAAVAKWICLEPTVDYLMG